MELENLIKQLQDELDRVTAEDIADKDELSPEDVSFNEGWANGMSRAIGVLKGAVAL